MDENHQIVWPNIKYYHSIEIKGTGTLHATFPALLYTRLNGYSTGDI